MPPPLVYVVSCNNSSTRTKLTFQLTPAAINGIISGRSTVAPRYTVFDVFHTGITNKLDGLEDYLMDDNIRAVL